MAAAACLPLRDCIKIGPSWVTMALDTALNLVWLAIGVSGLAALSFAEARHALGSRLGRLRRVVAVLIVMVALFPCVSFSDDLFSFSFLQSHLGKHGGVGTLPPEDSKEKSTVHLVRVLQSLEHFQACAPYAFAVTLWFFPIIVVAVVTGNARDLLCRAGRSPPAVFPIG